MSSIALPDELLLQILIRLPPKPLIRFRSVCKSWFALISNPHFISSHAHQNHTVGINSLILLRRFCRDQKREIYTLHDEKDDCKTIGELIFPFKAQSSQQYFRIAGYVNGLICLWDDTNNQSLNPIVILWNPAIRKTFTLPCLADFRPIHPLLSNQKLTFGFGYDAFTNDYKILRLTISSPYLFYERRLATFSSVVAADVFSLKNQSWKSVSVSMPRKFKQVSIPIFLNGTLHWLTWKDQNSNFFVVTFGLNVEAFGEMACPKEVKFALHSRQSQHKIAISCNSLALINQRCEYRYHIWVMKEYGVVESWTKVFSIDLDVFYPITKKSILGFSSGGGGVVVIGNGQWTIHPGLESLQIMHFEPPGLYTAPHVELYTESLVLLDFEDNDSHQLKLIMNTDVEDERGGHKRRKKDCDHTIASNIREESSSFASIHQ